MLGKIGMILRGGIAETDPLSARDRTTEMEGMAGTEETTGTGGMIGLTKIQGETIEERTGEMIEVE
eukprot:gene8812-18077_t